MWILSWTLKWHFPLCSRTDFPRPRSVNEFQHQLRWRWAALYAWTSNTLKTDKYELEWHGGGGQTPPSQCGGGETSASTYFWILPTLLLSQSLTDNREIVCITRVWKTNLGALDSPGCHNHSLTTSLPRSYIPYTTLHLPDITTISTHQHI